MHLSYTGTTKPLPFDDEFWPKISSGGFDLDDGRLLSRGSMDTTWKSWEMHPAGDEIVLLLRGVVDFVLEVDGAEKVVTLDEPMSFVVVPAGVWHTARVREAGEAIFITPGKGTENRPVSSQ